MTLNYNNEKRSFPHRFSWFWFCFFVLHCSFKFGLFFRVCVETMLPEEVLFSIDCLIHQSDIKIDDGLFHPKEILHVQNISHWAPASIGPYSQSIKVSRHVFLFL